jgi:superfamily II DNA/RNA helicase
MCIKECLDFAEVGKIVVFATTIDVVNLLAERMDCQPVTSGIAIDFERFDKRRIIVASSCAGHGLDIKDIYAVPILGVPFDAETLLQWAGRIRKSGFVKLFLNRCLVASLSKRVDRRGELAKVFMETAENTLQEAICHLIDEGCEEQEQGVTVTTGRQRRIFEWRVLNYLKIAVQVPCSPRLQHRSRLQHRGQSHCQVTIHSISFDRLSVNL